jgi:hypothetical protein
MDGFHCLQCSKCFWLNFPTIECNRSSYPKAESNKRNKRVCSAYTLQINCVFPQKSSLAWILIRICLARHERHQDYNSDIVIPSNYTNM